MLNEELSGSSEGIKTFDELLSENKDYQSAHDKKVSQGIKTALETEKRKLQQEQISKISKLTSTLEMDFKELKNMKEMDKLEYYYDNLAKELERLIKENNSYKLKEQAIEIAKTKNMDLDLLNLLEFSNMDNNQLESNIDWIVKCFNKSLEKQVNESVNNDDDISNYFITIGDKKYKIASVGINWVDIELTQERL